MADYSKMTDVEFEDISSIRTEKVIRGRKGARWKMTDKHVVAFVCAECGNFGIHTTDIPVEENATRYLIGDVACHYCGASETEYVVLSKGGRRHAGLILAARKFFETCEAIAVEREDEQG